MYINKTIENGWSLNVLSHQIDINLYERQIDEKKVRVIIFDEDGFPIDYPFWTRLKIG